MGIALVAILFGNIALDDPFGNPAHAQTSDSSIDFAENRAVPVATFLAYDQDGDTLNWSLGGPDDDLFTIDDGVLAFREPPNYEDPQSATSGVSLAERNVYRVTVRAGGGTHDVAVYGHGRGRARNGEHGQTAAAGIPAALSQPLGRGRGGVGPAVAVVEVGRPDDVD